MKPNQDAQNTQAPVIASISLEDLRKGAADDISQLRKELKKYQDLCFHLANELTIVLDLVHGIELINHYEDDNVLQAPEDCEMLCACAAVKDAATAQIKSSLDAMIALAADNSCSEEATA